MTASDFVMRVKAGGIPVYWLGPASGSKYTFNNTLGYVNIVSYIPSGSKINEVAKQQLIVETYASAKDLADQHHAIVERRLQTAVTQNGMTTRYDAKNLNWMMVEIDGVPQVIEVEYPKKQSEAKLLLDAGKLTLVK